MRTEDLVRKYDIDNGLKQAVSRMLSHMTNDDIVNTLTDIITSILYKTSYNYDLRIDDGSNVQRDIEAEIKERLKLLIVKDDSEIPLFYEYIVIYNYTGGIGRMALDRDLPINSYEELIKIDEYVSNVNGYKCMVVDYHLLGTHVPSKEQYNAFLNQVKKEELLYGTGARDSKNLSQGTT